MKNWNHLSVFLEGMENVGRKIHLKLLRINDKSHNSVVLDDLNLRWISLSLAGFLECAWASSFIQKGESLVFGQTYFFFSKRWHTKGVSTCYSSLFSLTVFGEISLQKTKKHSKKTGLIPVAFDQKSFRFPSCVCC